MEELKECKARCERKQGECKEEWKEECNKLSDGICSAHKRIDGCPTWTVLIPALTVLFAILLVLYNDQRNFVSKQDLQDFRQDIRELRSEIKAFHSIKGGSK